MNDNASNNAALDEQLVAYLDGELDAESGRRIEALLASDPEVRRRLQSLERTWDLLDELDAAPVGEPFTQTTLEMVTVAAHDDLERSRAEVPRRRRRWLLTVGGGLLAAVAAGFCAVALVAPDPNRQLLEDLPVLENFDEYRQVESVDFLRKLRDEKLFLGKTVNGTGSAAAADEDAAARKRRVEDMNSEQKLELLRTEERFMALTAEEQQRLRRLHENLRSSPDAGGLRTIMRNYCEWSKSLTPLSWTELADVPLNERIAWVKQRQQEQSREGVRRLDPKDVEKLGKWFDAFATKHEARFRETLSSEAAKKNFAEMAERGRRRMMLGQFALAAESGKLLSIMTDEDLSQLRASLSANMRESLEKLPPAGQWKQVARWMRLGPRRPGEDRGVREPMSPDDDEKRLIEFFEKGLKPEEIDRLLAMPGEEMQWELQRLFMTRNRPPEGAGHRSEGPWRGKAGEKRDKANH